MELRVVRGNPTSEEIAALLAVLPKRETAKDPEPRWATTAKPGFFHPDGRSARTAADAWRLTALPR